MVTIMYQKIKENKISVIGFFLILFSIFLLLSDSLTPYIRPITSIFLMGSSKGKDILFFGIMGSLLLFSPFFSTNLLKNMKFLKNLNSDDFLKISLCITFITYLIAILLEIMLRLKYNVPINTTFISMDGTNINTSSIIHSHLFKSVIGMIISKIMTVPNGIHTGTSLLGYTSSLNYHILLILPLIYISNLFALNNKTTSIKIILSFSLTLSFIALFDGGLFSIPGYIGLFISLIIIKWDSNKKILSLITPTIIILTLFSIETIFSLTCGISTHYEVYILNPTDDLNITDSIPNLEKISNDNNHLILKISSSRDYNERELIDYLIKKLNGKCDSFFITGNSMSYLKDYNL